MREGLLVAGAAETVLNCLYVLTFSLKQSYAFFRTVSGRRITTLKLDEESISHIPSRYKDILQGKTCIRKPWLKELLNSVLTHGDTVSDLDTE